MAEVLGGGLVVLAEPAADGGDGAAADEGDVFLAGLPGGVEGLGGHAELAVGVVLDEMFLAWDKGVG